MSAINNLPGLAKFNNATHETDGLMSRNDKQKLDSLHKSVTIHATLYASEWSENRPYTQTIDIPDITSETNGSLTIDPLATDEQLQACIDADIIITEQAMNYMTLQVTSEKPEVDIPVIIVFGENLAVITPPTIVDTGNHVHNIIIQPNDWVPYLDTYKTTLNIPGINESLVGSISMKSGIEEDEAFEAAKARIEVLNIFDDTVELILRGEKPSMPLHITVYYGPSIAIVRKPVFGGKITPHAKYQEFDDSKTGLGVTNTQSAIETMVTGTTGINAKPTHFKTVAVMKEAMELQVGQLVVTSGYRYENDGGGATYLITANNKVQDNGGSVHVLKNGLKAEFVHTLGEDINLKCFGLYGDAIHDDTPAFQRGFDYCKAIKGGTVRWQGIAAINEPLVVDSHYINIKGYGYGSTIKANFESNHVLAVTYEEHSTTEELQQVYIGKFRIDGQNKARHGLLIDDNLPIYNCIFELIHIFNTEDHALVMDSCKNCELNLITIDKCFGGIKILGTSYNNTFDSCSVTNTPINEALLITANENSKIEERPTKLNFNNCYFGNSESEVLINIDRSMNINFNDCEFDLGKTVSTDYPIVIGEYALYTTFNNTILIGKNKEECGIIDNKGPNTTINNFKGIDIKSQIHVRSYDHITINNMTLVGDSTPLVIYTPNDDKTILNIDSVIKTYSSDRELFPSNANYYNIYMNYMDEIGIKGRMNNYVLDTYVENELLEELFNAYDTTELNADLEFPFEGVWEVDTFLTVDDGNKGRIGKYQITFKNNSVNSIANIQELITPIEWGTGIELTEMTIDKLGKLHFLFKDTTNTNRYSWELKVKAKRVMNYDFNYLPQ